MLFVGIYITTFIFLELHEARLTGLPTMQWWDASAKICS